MATVSGRVQLLRFPTALERDPAIDAWFESRSGRLAAIARPWYERMRHVKLHPDTEIDRVALVALIQAAYSRVKSLARSGR